SDRSEVEVEDTVEPQLAADALVRDRRVDVAIADHRCSALERWADDLGDVLRARCRVQESLRPGAHIAPGKDEVTDALAELGSSRFARGHHFETVLLEARGEELCLGRLAGAVEALEGDEHRLHPTVVRRIQPCGRSSPEVPGSSARTSWTPS